MAKGGMVESQTGTAKEHVRHAERAIALVDGSDAGDVIASLLLEDLADALRAYAWMSGASKPQVERVSIDEPECANASNVPAADTSANAPSAAVSPTGALAASATESGPARTSALVVALPAGDGAEQRLGRTLERALKGALPRTDGAAPVLVYVIAYIKENASAADAARLDSLADACQECGTLWGGGILLGESALCPKLFSSPRLGAYRRPISQAIDRLIAAVRMGKSMEETARITGRSTCENVVAASPGLAPLSRLLFS